jgi:hypothetical protein
MIHDRRGAAMTALALAIAAGAALVSFRATYEPDLWWHLAQGRETAAGHLVRANLFSFTYPDYRQHYTSWLFDVGAYELWTRVGPTALQFAQAAAIAATLWIVTATCRIRASVAAAVAVCAFGWLILEPRALPRPHVLSFVGLATCAYLVERARYLKDWRPLRWTPLLIAVWANLHVECVFGVALVGAFGVGELLRPRDLVRRGAIAVIAIATASLLATAINPYGFGLLEYLFENAFVPQIVKISEVLPPYLPNYRAFFVWAVIVLTAMLLLWRRLALSDILMLAPIAYLGFSHLRMTPLFFLASASLVARALEQLRTWRIEPRAVAITAVAAILVLARIPLPAMLMELGLGRRALMPPEFFSEPAMQFVRGHQLSGPVFASMNLGGFVAWELYPAVRTFVDSRLQAYPPQHFRMVIEASRDPQSWAAITSGVDVAILSSPRPNELSGVGQFREPEWRLVFKDASTEILLRRNAAQLLSRAQQR